MRGGGLDVPLPFGTLNWCCFVNIFTHIFYRKISGGVSRSPFIFWTIPCNILFSLPARTLPPPLNTFLMYYKWEGDV